VLARLTKRLLESALEGEITDHLGYDRHDAAGRDGRNSRGRALSQDGVDFRSDRSRSTCPVTGTAPSNRRRCPIRGRATGSVIDSQRDSASLTTSQAAPLDPRRGVHRVPAMT
jgi:hypothetical protein